MGDSAPLAIATEFLRPGAASVGDNLFDYILGKIARGEWPIGYTLASEGELVEQFAISRIAVRECVLKLRALGVLESSRGRRTTVAKIDSRMMGRLFPLILANEGHQSFEHVFQLRLLVEADSAHKAARNRSEEELARMQDIIRRMESIEDGDTDEFVATDRALHLQIAQASRNPMYQLLVEALWGFLHMLHPIIHRDCGAQRSVDEHHHRAIVEAIALQNADRARVELEAHLQSSADHIRASGVLDQLRPK